MPLPDARQGPAPRTRASSGRCRSSRSDARA